MNIQMYINEISSQTCKMVEVTVYVIHVYTSLPPHVWRGRINTENNLQLQEPIFSLSKAKNYLSKQWNKNWIYNQYNQNFIEQDLYKFIISFLCIYSSLINFKLKHAIIVIIIRPLRIILIQTLILLYSNFVNEFENIVIKNKILKSCFRCNV